MMKEHSIKRSLLDSSCLARTAIYTVNPSRDGVSVLCLCSILVSWTKWTVKSCPELAFMTDVSVEIVLVLECLSLCVCNQSTVYLERTERNDFALNQDLKKISSCD